MDESYRLMSGPEFVNSIRSSGYSDTGHALGELIDNSIQAGATKIKIAVEVTRELISKRNRDVITRIAVIDNGCGMNPELLRSALIFGSGTNFGRKRSLGKFGVGLPQSSVSQAKKLEVWSKTAECDDVYYTGFDIGDEEWIEEGAEIPKAKICPLPKPWSNYIDSDFNSGTIVLWSSIDRVNPKGVDTLYKDLESLIGRMYRYWINSNKVCIEYYSFKKGDSDKIPEAKVLRAEDPLYLMENTNVEDLDPPVSPMFEPINSWNAEGRKITVPLGHGKSKIIIRGTVAKPEIRKLVNKSDAAGSKSYGKHAKRNTGVSVLRENRELEIQHNWADKDPRNRWWGVEVSFDSDLDDLFGVTNNKQSANNLKKVIGKTFEDYAKDGESRTDVKERLRYEDISTLIMLEVGEAIYEYIKSAKKKIESAKPSVSEMDTDSVVNVVEKKVTENTNKLKEKGQTGLSDSLEENYDDESKKKMLVDVFHNCGFTDEKIQEIVEGYVTNQNKYHFVEQHVPNDDSFFIPKYDAGVIVIILNTAHPIYSDLFGIFKYMESGYKESKEKLSPEVQKLLKSEYFALKMIMVSWARMEDIYLKDGKSWPFRARSSWGKSIKELNGDEYDDDF